MTARDGQPLGREHAFAHQFTVAHADIDALGHANNTAYVRWIQDVAVAHSEQMGLALADYQSLGAVFVIRRHEIDYLRAAMENDRLEVRTWIDSARSASCMRATEIARVSDGAVLVKAMTTWAFIDTQSGRPTRITPEVRLKFGFPPE
jgi:acyl-CoA thioester hydrolase